MSTEQTTGAEPVSPEDMRVTWQCLDRPLRTDLRPLVMGILNVTPDSFSDGGRYVDVDAAVRRGLQMIDEGADIVDVGGESTRPGAASVAEEEESRRVVPVLKALRDETTAVLSVDTSKAAVAAAAIEAGADVVNDVTAMTGDPGMPDVARQSRVGVVLMHMRGSPRTMQHDPRYDNVVEEVAGYLMSRVECLAAQGVERDRMAIDPGIGFGKTVEHNLQLLAGLPRMAALGFPVVVGLSRKSFLGKLAGGDVEERLPASLAGLVCSVLNGARVMRVHDVKESVAAVRMAMAAGKAREGELAGGME